MVFLRPWEGGQRCGDCLISHDDYMLCDVGPVSQAAVLLQTEAIVYTASVTRHPYVTHEDDCHYDKLHTPILPDVADSPFSYPDYKRLQAQKVFAADGFRAVRLYLHFKLLLLNFMLLGRVSDQESQAAYD